jgi:molecular chaperone Hsp33
MGKDKIIRSTGETAELRFVLVDATNSANQIGEQHGAQGEALQLLGEAAVSSLLLASGLKFNGVVQTHYRYQGDISGVQADGTPMGLVRARIPQEELLELQKRPVGMPLELQEQTLAVRKLNDKGKNIQESLIEMPSLKIGPTLAAYQLQSEQIQSAVGVASRLDPDSGELAYCVGFLVETFPKADAETVATLEKSIQSLPEDFGQYTSQGEGFHLEGLLQDLAGPYAYQIHREIDVQPYCPCSKAGVERSIVSLGIPEITRIVEQGEEVELFCDFCRKRYVLQSTEVNTLLKRLENQ